MPKDLIGSNCSKMS